MKKGNELGDLPSGEMFEVLDLLKKAGVTPMMLLGSLLKQSDIPEFRLLAQIVAPEVFA